MLSQLIAVFAIVGGILALALSIPRQVTPEYLALVSVAAFALACALGILRGVDILNGYVKARMKQGG